MLRPHARPIGLKSRPSELLPADSCGCQAGARFLSVALVGSIIWYGRQHLVASLPLRTAVLWVLIISTAAAIFGKVVGLLLHRFRPRH